MHKENSRCSLRHEPFIVSAWSCRTGKGVKVIFGRFEEGPGGTHQAYARRKIRMCCAKKRGRFIKERFMGFGRFRIFFPPTLFSASKIRSVNEVIYRTKYKQCVRLLHFHNFGGCGLAGFRELPPRPNACSQLAGENIVITSLMSPQ